MRILKSFTCLAIVTATLAFAGPAGAHHPAVTGVATCSDGSHLVTWTITNSLARKPMTVSATAMAEGVAYDVSVVTNPVPAGESTDATTVVPGAVIGSITITVVATYPDDFTKTISATVDLPESCVPTETTAPATTAPTPTSTGVAPSSIVPTTGPAGVAGVESVPGTLPNTGATDTGAHVVVGLALLMASAGLLALKRRPARQVP